MPENNAHGPCKHCGTCPCCGRGPQPNFVPYYNYPYPYWWYTQPTYVPVWTTEPNVLLTWGQSIPLTTSGPAPLTTTTYYDSKNVTLTQGKLNG
jgi:hypothetical protein